MDSPSTHHATTHGLAPPPRKWPVGVVLAIALALALAVPLVGRAFGAETYPNCAIAPWTGTCTCMMQRGGMAMSYEDFAMVIRRPGAAPRGANPEYVLADARKSCRLDRPVTHSAEQ